MVEICETAKAYKLLNIYNEDDSGLKYLIGPSRSYLSPDESRNEIRGTLMQKSKELMTAMFGVNDDGSYKPPIRYVGKSVTPKCFQDHPTARLSYSAKKCAWIGSDDFDTWLKW